MTFASRITFAIALVVAPVAAHGAVPHQFIAKTYTEALGRVPDQGAYQGGVNHFNNNGCSKSTLKAWGRNVYLSPEYASFGYDNAAKVLTFSRGILNREPDASGLNYWKGLLDSGSPMATVIDGFFDSTEFGSLVTAICTQPSYGFRNAPVIDLPVSGSGYQGSQTGLQALIDATPAGGTVWLAQKAVIRLTSPLVVKEGITLATIGNPTPRRYALMARLVREVNFNDSAVRMRSGSKLKYLWVDGSRGRLGYSPNSLNVLLLGGSGTTVSNCLISNSAGWTHLVAYGSKEGRPCASNVIDRNVVTAYSSTHTPQVPADAGSGWSDGLSVACENATVEYNEVIDATDVPIILFRATPAVQRSQVRYNNVLNAGNSAYGGLCTDHGLGTGRIDDFTGSSFYANTIWSGAGHFDIGLSVGTMAWWSPAESAMGSGASFTNNTTGSQKMIADVGIGVSGMLNATVQGNTLSTTLVNVSRCPGTNPLTANIVASYSAGYASGSIQGPIVDVPLAACIGH